MKINSTFTKLMMVTVFGLALHSCTTDDSTEPQQAKSFEPEVQMTQQMQSKPKDTLPSENEPIIVRPRG